MNDDTKTPPNESTEFLKTLKQIGKLDGSKIIELSDFISAFLALPPSLRPLGIEVCHAYMTTHKPKD